jgi:uncharacterized protein YutE (UPF0331/DUF86 family)
MDILLFIAELAKALAWPLTLLVLGMLFRAEIRLLLGRMKKGKVGAAELEFEVAVRTLESESKALTAPAAASALTAPQVALLSSDPRAAIIGAWLQVEDAVEQLLYARAASVDEVPKNRGALLRALTRQELLAPQHIALLNELRALRNQAVHEVDFRPAPDSVGSYIKLANELLAAIHAVAGKETSS